jgi:ribosome biogenesis GTPase
MAARRLTIQQKKRIQTILSSRRNRLQRRAADQALATTDQCSLHEGRVIIRHGATLGVQDSLGNIFRCLTRQNIGHPVCGDWVIWRQVDETSGVVTALQPRKSVLSRPDYNGQEKPLAANITQLVIVLAPEPEPTGYLLDQYLVTAENRRIPPLIAVNKVDLFEGNAQAVFFKKLAVYQRIGYSIISVSAQLEHGLDELIQRLKNETSILVGQSGVGKSSLINALLPEQATQTGRLSEATGLGKHTTSAATCYTLAQGGELIDSPGVRSFRLANLDPQQLEKGFPEFQPYLGHCRFHNCTHEHEPDCAIRCAVDQGDIDPLRLENFLRLRKSLSTKSY